MEYLILTLVFLAMGYGFGKYLEGKHYKQIKERESKFQERPAVTFEAIPEGTAVASAELVVGSVVVSIDYFKQFLSSFRMVFGGEMQSYSTLLDRGRREAILRMKECCPQADIYINTRLETASISKGNQKKIGSVEVVAYGTAVTYGE